MNWTAIVISVCLVLLLFIVWKEYIRPNRARLIWRLLAGITGIVAFACVALPITYGSKTITGSKTAVLLTSGFDEDSLLAYRSSKIFATETGVIKAHPKLNIALLSNMVDLPTGKYNIANVHVLGHGLSGDELSALGHFPIQFYGSDVKPGITHISWNHQLKVGEQLQVQGKFSVDAEKITLILKGLNSTLDSLVLQPNTNFKTSRLQSSLGGGNSNHRGDDVAFQLKTTPKNTGKANYNLVVLSGTDTVDNETIPFEVEPVKPVRVLMLATSPGFETRFLKNWLSEQGYSVAVRTTITKEKFSREYFNMAQVDVDKLTPTLLDKFDLVMGDLSGFKLLSTAENSVLRQQVVQKGLGLIVKADSSDKGSSFLSNVFGIEKLTDKNQKPMALQISGQTALSAKLNLDGNIIKPQANSQPLVTDEQNHIVANSTIYGSGKITICTIGNTFNWALAGIKADYTTLWSLLINKTSRKATIPQQWDVQPALALVNEPVTLSTEGPTTLPLQIKANQSKLAFSQNPVLPFRWTATYWPTTDGWQQITQNGVACYWWYSYKPNAWASLHAKEKIDATLKYAKQNLVKNKEELLQTEIHTPVSKLYFYILLLLCFSYLWAERKL